jgi:hypothetical protein
VIVLHAMSDYVGYAVNDDAATAFQNIFKPTEEEIMRIYTDAGDDAC